LRDRQRPAGRRRLYGHLIPRGLYRRRLAGMPASWIKVRGRRSGKCGSRLQQLEDLTVGGKGGGQQRPAAAGAGIERYRKIALDEAAPFVVEAANDPAEAVERPGQLEDVGGAPPE